mmetsp:Transcript_13957/g.58270  ORF Transcript_13957/g.58270 Transcript_13957/m.58270 type:complete len:210 (-) Transcript_13957:65-694(-)
MPPRRRRRRQRRPRKQAAEPSRPALRRLRRLPAHAAAGRAMRVRREGLRCRAAPTPSRTSRTSRCAPRPPMPRPRRRPPRQRARGLITQAMPATGPVGLDPPKPPGWARTTASAAPATGRRPDLPVARRWSRWRAQTAPRLRAAHPSTPTTRCSARSGKEKVPRRAPPLQRASLQRHEIHHKHAPPRAGGASSRRALAESARPRLANKF